MKANFEQLLASVYRGDPEAARQLFEEYGDLLRQVVRRHLPDQLRCHADSCDFVQETWLAFLKDVPKGRTFRSPGQLATFLATIARHKIIDAIRKTMGANFHRASSLPSSDDGDGAELPGQHSTPSQSMMRRECEEVLLKEFRPAHRTIARCIFEGQPPQGIAASFGISVRTVERIRERILERLQSL